MATELKAPAKAVLFDLDGVLARSDRLHFLAWKSLADARGWAFDEKLNERLRGVPRMESLAIILRANGARLTPEEAAKAAEEKNEIFRASIKSMTRDDLIPGALELLRGVRGLGAKTAVCSSSRNAPEIIETLKLAPLLDAVVSAKDVVKAKPDPEIFLKGAFLLKAPPALCVVVEDAQSGVDAALAAGMRCVSYAPAGAVSGATRNCESLLDLPPETLLAPEAAAR